MVLRIAEPPWRRGVILTDPEASVQRACPGGQVKAPPGGCENHPSDSVERDPGTHEPGQEPEQQPWGERGLLVDQQTRRYGDDPDACGDHVEPDPGVDPVLGHE